MQPTVVEDGRAALRTLRDAKERNEPFSLVLLDAHMPEIDGFEVAERIRDEMGLDGMTLMMLSSDDSFQNVQRCNEIGLAAHLVKPIKQSELLDMIMSVLHRKAIGSKTLETSDSSETASSQPVNEIANRSLNVLLAEDNNVNQQLMIRILERANHQVTIANNGREAVDFATSQDFDVVLMDVQMPIMDGVQATEEIRRFEQTTGRRLPIIALTAHAMKGDRDKCLASGMDAYISKPIQVDELMRALAEKVQAPQGQVASPQSQAAAVLLDREGVLHRVGRDVQFLSTMIEIFQEDSRTHLQQMRDAIQANNAIQLKESAHTIKGSAGNLGGEQLRTAAVVVEELAAKGQVAAAMPAVTIVERGIEDLVDARKHVGRRFSLTTRLNRVGIALG